MMIVIMMMIMNTITSTLFRVTYITINEPTEVTVNGRVIGTWMPSVMAESVKAPVRESGSIPLRTFTPVPKPTTRR
jgi:hypothetical protein